MNPSLQGQWALITGASSGFGREFCTLLAEQGCHLILAARRTVPMQELAQQLQDKHGIRTHIIGIDLAAPGAAVRLKAETDAAGLQVDVLINNAGVGMYGEFLEQSLPAVQQMIQLNVLTLMELTHLYGQTMKQRGSGRILLLASIAGFQSLPTYAAYCGSKAFVLHFGEALYQEMRPHGVQVTVLAPGISETAFFQVAGQQDSWYHRLVRMQARPVAAAGLQALMKGRPVILPGWLNQLTVFLFRFLPREWQSWLAGRTMQQHD